MNSIFCLTERFSTKVISCHLLVLMALHLLCSLVSAESLPLFNEDEIQKLNYAQDEWVLELDRHIRILHATRDAQLYSSGEIKRPGAGEVPGPIVSIIDPESEGDIYRSAIPVQLLVYLKSRMVPINIETLSIKGKRGIFTLNVTNRIKPYMRQPLDGENADYVIDANIPKIGEGRYLFILSIADIHGNQEEQKLFLEVSKH